MFSSVWQVGSEGRQFAPVKPAIRIAINIARCTDTHPVFKIKVYFNKM
jgi:hypothetical protein